MHVIDKQYLPDDELVVHFFRNDEKAFNEIHNRYWQRLYVFALSKLGDEENAEEAIQNVFIDLWQNGIQTRSKISPYTFTAR